MQQVGIRLTDAEAHAILDRYDPFGDGSISYTDFVDLVEGVVRECCINFLACKN
jgi:Ca2+-binding EF-hand superfamily protein